MKHQISTTADQNDLVNRFLAAADERLSRYHVNMPVKEKEARVVIAWLRGLVGDLNEDGSLGRLVPPHGSGP